MKKWLFSCWLMGLAVLSQATTTDRWLIKVHHQDQQQLQLLNERFDHYTLEQAEQIVKLEVSGAELSWLRANGFVVHINTAASARLQQALAENQRSAFQQRGGGIAGFSCYRTVEETFTTAMDLVNQYPQLASWTDVGDSWIKTQHPAAGYDLMVLRLTNQAITTDKPPLFISSGVHAREYTHAELVTRFAESLLAGYGRDADATWLLDHHDIHLLLQANPDGRKMAETGLSWRKNANNDHCPNSNNRGIDLNRNFDFQWGCCGGSSATACDQTFRGPFVASEPETITMQTYMDQLFTDYRDDDLSDLAPIDTTGVFLDIHSFGEVILSSWGFTSTPPPNGDGILSLARKMAFHNGYRPQLGSLGTVDGATKDYAYGRFGVPGYTLELGTAFFEDCGYFEESILPQNLPALLYAAKASRQPYSIALGPDVTAFEPFATPYVAGDSVALSAVADDQRYETGGGTEPSQNISEAQYSINTPPWDNNATVISLVAADGAFDAPQEALMASLNTQGLAVGQHTVFMRARDADGHWGAVSAQFLDIIDPLTSPVVEGTVTDRSTGGPLAGVMVSINHYQVTTDQQGVFQLQLPEGQYSLQASLTGYQSSGSVQVSLSNGQTRQQDFSLVPLIAVFEFDGESGSQGWQNDGQWMLSTEAANSPTHAWTDSEGGDYGNNLDQSLTMPVMDLSQASAPTLRFWHRYELESGFDYGHLEISTDNQQWTELQAFNGSSAGGGWVEASFDLTDWANQPTVYIRFRITSDSSVTRDGWYIDDISITAPSTVLPDLIFADSFDNP